jgi:hypothetical protein
MSYLDTIADYLEENRYTVQVGKLYNNSSNNTINTDKIVVYPQETSYRQCVGKLKRYNNQRAKILVHWNKSFTDTQTTALNVFNLFDCSCYNNLIFTPRQSTPIYMGTDSYDIHEYVIEIDILEGLNL